MDAMQLTLLGTGDAAQTPVYNCACRACERARLQPRYRRGPCCALIDTGRGRWLIDAGLPDLAERFPPGSLSGILLTHYHADHAQGLLHLRWGKNTRIPVLGPPDPDGLADLYKHPGILDFSVKLAPFTAVDLEGLHVVPVPLAHSRLTYGYVMEHAGQRLAYLTDTVGLPGDTAAFLRERPLDLLVLDCTHAPSQARPRNHNDLTRALETIRQLRPASAVLTHVSHELDAYLMEAPRSVLDVSTSAISVAADGDLIVLP